MKRTLALLLCTLMLYSLLPVSTGAQEEPGTGEVAWLSSSPAGGVGHGELFTPVLNYRNDDTEVEILVQLEWVTGEGFTPVQTRPNFFWTTVPKGQSHGISIFNHQIAQDVPQDKVTVTAKVLVQPLGGFSYELTRSMRLPIRHDHQCTPHPDGIHHILTCACGREKSPEPHILRYIIYDDPLMGSGFNHRNFCDTCLLDVLAPCVFDEGVIKPPTCINRGYTWYTCILCTRGEAEEYTPPTNKHTPGPWQMSGNNDGHRASHKNACTICSAITTEPCSFDPGTVKPPTCFEGGYTSHTCTICNYVYADEYLTEVDHQFSNWAFSGGSAPEQAKHTGSCIFCNASLEEACSFGQGSQTSPTCVSPGYITYACNRCSCSYEVEDGEQLEHDWGAPQPAENDPGNHTQACKSCGASQEAHCSYGSGIETPATCTLDGVITYTCESCGFVREDTGEEKLDHEWGACAPSKIDPGHHIQTCSACGATQENLCNYAVAATSPATCMKEGFTTYQCDLCGHAYDTTDGEKLEHSWGECTPSDESPGEHVQVCSTCGASQKTSCTYVPGIVRPATCTTPGFAAFACAFCNHSYKVKTGETLQHEWSDCIFSESNPGKHTQACTVCGATQENLCNYAVAAASPATCIKEGFTTYQCGLCGHAYDTIDGEKLEHSWGDCEPSLSNPGKHTQTCITCSTTREDPCNYAVAATSPATCTAEGFTTYQCGLCGHAYDANDGEKLEHSWGACEPSQSNPGKHHQTCKTCRTTQTSSCTYGNMDVVTPTCNKGGYTRMACQDCGFHQQILPTPPTGFHSIPEWRDMGEAGHAGVCRDCEKSFIKEHDMAWTPAASGAHTGRCTACGFKRAVPALGCDIRMPGIFVALGHTITPAWTLSGGLPPYKILACYVKTRQEGALPHQDLVHHGGQASFTPDAGAGTAVDFVLRFRDSLGAVFQHSASFFVTSGQSFDVDLELPDNVATGDSITATWHLSQAVDPVHVAGLWSVYEGDNLLDSAPCADRNNTCTFAPAAGSRGVLTLRFEDAAGRTVEETRPFTITQPVQTPAPVLVEGIELTGQLQLTTGSAHQLHARVFPDHADTRGLHWSSSDDSIAKVNQEGTVIALAPGQATITASTTDGSGITAACLVTVIRPALPGDADNNQQVDVKDLMRMVDFLVMGSPVPSPDNANLVSDGEELHINLEDILKLIAMIVGS